MDIWSPGEIKELRKTLQFTQKIFAEYVGVTDIYINYLEKGVRKPSKTLCILFECLRRQEKRKESGEIDETTKGVTKTKRDLPER